MMIGDRVEHFEGKGTDLRALQSHVEQYLKGGGSWNAEIEAKLMKDLRSFVG
jgi:hypothetical protein